MRVIGSRAELEALVGQELGLSDWFRIEQSMIDRFAEMTLDRQWIHLDAERARRESPYGATVAHGFLTLSLLSHLAHMAFEFGGPVRHTINYGFNRVRFTGPVLAGSRVRGRFSLLSVEDIEGGVQVVYRVLVERESEEKPAIAAEWVTRVYGA